MTARNLPQLLRDAERRVNAHVWPNRAAGHDAHLASIPANRDTDTDLLLIEAANRIEKLEAALTPSTDTKAEYSGEFTFDAHADMHVMVPWTTIKEIMAYILKRATSEKASEAKRCPMYWGSHDKPCQLAEGHKGECVYLMRSSEIRTG